jgi:murein L,D-transpeptidase YcbB/YkuD
MRKLLLATSAVALALTFAASAGAEPNKVVPTAATVAPPEATTPEGLMFSKDADQAKPIDKPGEKAVPAVQAPEPVQPAEAAKPAEQAAPVVAAPALSPEDAAVAAQLKELLETKFSQSVPREQDRAGVLAFYKARDFAPLWIAAGKPAPRADQAKSFLKGVEADGLNPADYATPAFTDPAKLATDELALTNSVVTFSRHASIGRVAYTRVSGAVYYDRKAPNAADVLGKLTDSTDVRATLDAFNPQSQAYKALKAQLVEARSGKAEAKAIMSEPTKAPAKDSKATKHDVKAVEEKPKTANADTIIANMERWRWMPHDLGSTYVMVNIPDYTLKVVQDGKTVWTTRIVVGKPGEHATPLLTETMKYITVNPTWNVPPSIIRNEYLPALARDPGALARIGLQISHNPDGSVRIFQPPGERNALGRIRFNFPNRFLVYQHDTPDKKLFALASRAYSHGCMRVQNPDEYAEVLLGVSQPEEKYTAARIKAMYGTTERTINFKHPIPVYITYQTAFVDDAGKAQARADIYNLDRETLNVLHGDRRSSDTPIARNYNSSSKPVMSSAAPAPATTNNWRRELGYAATPGYTTRDSFDIPAQLRSAYQPSERNKIW